MFRSKKALRAALNALLAAMLCGNGILHAQTTVESQPQGPDIEVLISWTDQPVKVDGSLDDPAWAGARPWIGRFFQQEPLDREPSSQITEIRVLQDERNLYFGVRCRETDPSRIYATVKRRDGSFLSDDALELLIDTFHDRRNSYAFGTNPFGAMVDAIISDEGDHINKSWDCVWYCKTTTDSEGWNVEMSIPFKSLKYLHGDNVDWGLNITREIKHSKEVTYLAPIPRGLGHNGKFKGSLFATLRGIRTPRSGLNLELEPYLTTGKTWVYDPRNFDSQFEGGLDVRYHVTPQFTADFTWNTDFAQAEAEEAVVNVTRFNVSLPEKRDFFLQSAGIFQFGSTGQSGGTLVGVSSSSAYKLFESRTIGIVNEQRVPLYGGAKIAGRAGGWSLGLINFESKAAELEGGQESPATNFTVMKVRRDLFNNSNVGLMFLNKQSSGGKHSRAVGSDFFFALSPEFSLNGTLALNLAPGVSSRNWAGDAGFIMNKDWVDFALHYSFVDTLFRPEMSYIMRENIRSTDATLSFTKWINNDYLKSVSLISDNDYLTDNHNTLLTREFRANTLWTMRSEDSFEFGVHRKLDHLPTVDYIQNIPIAPGDYSGTHYHLNFNSYRSRRVAGGLTLRWGDELDGDTRSIGLSSAIKITNSLFMDLGYTREHLELFQGTFDANILMGRWTYSFSTDLFAKCYVQWNDADNRVRTNFVLDYIYKPKSHIYLVFNENRYTYADAIHDVQDRMLVLKFTYLYSL